MDTSVISRAEHDEFCRRLEAEHKRLAAEDNRQNHRLDTLEEKVEQIGRSEERRVGKSVA